MAAELAARVENFDPMRIAAAFSDMGLPPVSADPELGAYIPELNVYPNFPLEFSPMPTRDAFDAATIYSPEISPDVGLVGLLVARLEHAHRRLVGVQHAVAQQLGRQRHHQRLQLCTALAHPLRQGRARGQ